MNRRTKVFPETKGQLSTLEGYIPSMTMTQDGNTAYFSKSSEQKPLYGLFSKKEVVHEIYRAEKIDGTWGNITKLMSAQSTHQQSTLLSLPMENVFSLPPI